MRFLGLGCSGEQALDVDLGTGPGHVGGFVVVADGVQGLVPGG